MSNDRQVFALHGADPEVLAYAMAKYSRSALSMKDAITEINAEKAGKFLDTYYFKYGHRSIADLAHVPLAIENISLLAAIGVVDESKWDGQERSTRYQDFSTRDYYTPSDLSAAEDILYRTAIHRLFDDYEALSKAAFDLLVESNPIPTAMSQGDYERTLKARAFDFSRYLLPLATKTSVGQITSARILEEQASRLMSSPHQELVEIGEQMREAVTTPAFNVNHKEASGLLARSAQHRLHPETIDEIATHLLREVSAAPTLVKYAAPNEYAIKLREALREIAAREFTAEESYLSVVLHTFSTLEQEIAATLIFEHSNLPMWTIKRQLGLRNSLKEDIIRTAMKLRGPHDPLPRAFQAGQQFTFEITMDIGGMRDLHRHRRCTQIAQEFTNDTFTVPQLVGLDSRLINRFRELSATYSNAVSYAHSAFGVIRQLRQMHHESLGPETYLLPLGTNCRFLMKMDYAQFAYIAELRTAPAGHISYRHIAFDMYTAVAERHPELAAGLRVANPAEPIDIFKR